MNSKQAITLGLEKHGGGPGCVYRGHVRPVWPAWGRPGDCDQVVGGFKTASGMEFHLGELLAFQPVRGTGDKAATHDKEDGVGQGPGRVSIQKPA